MAYDAGMLACVVHEINEKAAGGKIEKIYQPERDEINLIMRNNGESIRILINAGSNYPRLNMTKTAKENPSTPPMFCMMLRKHLTGARLSKCTQYGFERACEFEFDAFDDLGFPSKKYLIAEVMGKYSNLIFTDENKKILNAMKIVDLTTSQKRQVLPSMIYELPPKQDKISPLDETQENFLALIESQPAESSAEKFITKNYMGISALVAREIVFLATRAVDSSVGETGGRRLYAAFESVMEQIKTHAAVPTMISGDDGKSIEYCFCDIKQYGNGVKLQKFESTSDLIDVFFSTRSRNERIKTRASDIFKLLANAETRITKKISLQADEIEKCDEGERFKLWGDLITANIWRIKRGDREAEVENYYSESAELETINIPLDVRLSPSQNAQRFYKRYTKSKTARVELARQTALAYGELEYIYTVLDSLTRAETEQDLSEIREELYQSGYASKMKNYTQQKNKAPAIMKFKTDGGCTVYCGRNNLQNDYITTKLADKYDWWFHVKNRPGSHVVMLPLDEEPTELDFTQAAQIAAFYSKAGDSASSTAVDYTLIRNVKKPSGSKPGFVTYGTNWTAFVTPDEDVVTRLKV